MADASDRAIPSLVQCLQPALIHANALLRILHDLSIIQIIHHPLQLPAARVHAAHQEEASVGEGRIKEHTGGARSLRCKKPRAEAVPSLRRMLRAPARRSWWLGARGGCLPYRSLVVLLERRLADVPLAL